MKPPFIRSPYNYDLAEASNAAAEHNQEPSLTLQSQAEDADINVLMKRYGITGKFPENPHTPIYADFEEIFDFRTAHEAVLRAQDMFMEYPADLRARFQNDPQQFLEFCSNKDNLAEMRKIGLAKPEPPAAPQQEKEPPK